MHARAGRRRAVASRPISLVIDADGHGIEGVAFPAGGAPREAVAAGRVWVSCEPGETLLPAVVDALGDDFLLYASDYPHWDSEFPESAKHLRERTDLDAETKAKILGGNAQRLFGI